MSWSAPITFVAGSIFTAAQANVHMNANPNALHTGSWALSGQLKNDYVFALSPTQYDRHPMGWDATVADVGPNSTADTTFFSFSATEMTNKSRLILTLGALLKTDPTGGFVSNFDVRLYWGASAAAQLQQAQAIAADATERSVIFQVECLRVGADLWVLPGNQPQPNPLEAWRGPTAGRPSIITAPTFTSTQTVILKGQWSIAGGTTAAVYLKPQIGTVQHIKAAS